MTRRFAAATLAVVIGLPSRVAVAQSGAHPLFEVAAAQSTAVALIAQMYEEYSWETEGPGSPGRKPLFSAPAAVLQRFFDGPLTKAILADRACEARVQGECNLDFDPMWNSQDPGGVSAQVVPTRDSMVVQARLHYPYDNETRVVTYRLRNTPAGLRIADMSAPRWPSLLKLLRHDTRHQ